MMHHPDATKYVYHSRPNVYQLYKNTPAWHGQLPGARATDDVGRDRPGAQQTLAATPTLTMVMPLPHREARMLLSARARPSPSLEDIMLTMKHGAQKRAPVKHIVRMGAP